MPNKIKLERYEYLIKDIINNALSYEVNDNIAHYANVTYVKLTNDLSYASVYLDCLHRENIEKVVSHVVKIKGFLKSKLSQHLTTYKIPELRFFPDNTLDYAANIEKLFKEIKDKENKK
ncbi:MAG: 30S ribosome-binding factor RbfA [Candidatus Ureaplasma intestinipullorum]|uniref:Ribosome-binding factor A n=1 Tax=Candidatus Ureaplasma intestinipullorum TaxID=2838770 RepID=A0A9E2NW12_9BACT|nr:30S ribosome-binding factor RbfA [Candidatus Ureaplasma intestinipullorum]